VRENRWSNSRIQSQLVGEYNTKVITCPTAATKTSRVSQIMESQKITATSEQVAQHKAGPIVAVAFAEDYPAGSEGNDCAAEMVSYLRSALATSNAAAVLFDLRKLQYTWGDAIGGFAWALQEHAARIRPSAIVAGGRTARSLSRYSVPNSFLARCARGCSAPSPRRSIISSRCLDRRLANEAGRQTTSKYSR
jgi:hypothetical protein